jgi:hypothetical protein
MTWRLLGSGLPPPRAQEPLGLALQLWPEEFLEGWDPATSRLFVPALAEAPLGTPAAVRITIRGTGIGAAAKGPIVAVRRVGGPGLVPGAYVGLDVRGRSAAEYLERVARGQPVEFNERDPRCAVFWRVLLTRQEGRFVATTLDVSDEGCSVSWFGPALAVDDELRIRPRSLFWPSLPASVCWVRSSAGSGHTAGLHLEGAGRAARKWRTAVAQALWSGAPAV